MKRASVRELRNQYTAVLGWIDAGEEVLITKRGKVIARLSPEKEDPGSRTDWKNSPEVTRKRNDEVCLSAEDSEKILKEAGGRW